MTGWRNTLVGVLIGATPLWFLFPLYGFWLLSYVYLGVWPRQYIADPQDLPFGYYYESVAIGWVCWPLIFVGPVVGLTWLKHSGGKLWPGGLAFAVSLVTAYFLWSNDPGGCIEWFWD